MTTTKNFDLTPAHEDHPAYTHVRAYVNDGTIVLYVKDRPNWKKSLDGAAVQLSAAEAREMAQALVGLADTLEVGA